MFGTGNQLLATIALAVGTTFLINMGKAKYAWITAIPMCFVGITTLSAGVLSIKTIYWPLAHQPGDHLYRRRGSGANRIRTAVLEDTAWCSHTRGSIRTGYGGSKNCVLLTRL